MKLLPFAWPPAAAIFDMDGLMLDTESIYHRAYQTVGRELGYTLSDELVWSTSGRTFADGFRLIQAALGPQFPMDVFMARWPILWHQDVAQNGISHKPGLLPLLVWIDQQRIPKAVATSSSHDEAYFTLGAGGIADYFSTVVTGDEIVYGKPAPDIYLLAAARLGVDPARALAFEDSEPGVISAAAAGMVVIMAPDGKPPSAEVAARATLVVPTLHEALCRLSELAEASRS